MAMFDRLFYSGPMLALFSDESRLQHMLDFESALASAEAAHGVIPRDAAETITKECRAGNLDSAALCEDCARTGNLAIPLVSQLVTVVARKNAEAARYVHWGATSQDVIDTGFVLQIREAHHLIDESLQRLSTELIAVTEKHAETMMPGRTWLQQAVPVTFGWKTAGWLDAMLRHQSRMQEIRGRVLTLQFGGAAGTLASLGPDGLGVSETLADVLGLSHPDISWHTARDRFGEVAALLGLIVSTLGKIARDISLLMQTEVAEAFEAVSGGRGSSTMPQKQNPVACAAVLAVSTRIPGLVATMLASSVQEHERGLGNWQSEWETLPELFNLCAGALERTIEMIVGLRVDSARMAANLNLTNGLVFAEAVTMALAPQIGKNSAHELVERACRKAVEQKRHLRMILHEDAALSKLIAEPELKQLFEPARYLGIARKSIDLVLARASASGVASPYPWIELGDVRIHSTWSGPVDKPVLVLSNSLGANLHMWDVQIDEFSKHFRVLRYDSRGQGHSSSAPGPYSIEDMGRDVVALLDRLGIESCSFCGLSMGGLVGQWLGLNAAPRMRKLVLCNTAAKIGSVDSWNSRIEIVRQGGIEPIASSVLERWFTPEFQQNNAETIARIRMMIESGDRSGYVACCAALRDCDLRDSVHRIQVPTMVIAGTHDPATPPTDGRWLAETIAGAQYVELNASHLSNIEAAEEFTSAVLQFLLQ